MNDYFNPTKEQLSIQVLHFGVVVSNDDKYKGRKLKVRIQDIDKNVTDANLPECYPLFPPFFHTVPSVGERVAVFLFKLYNSDKQANQEKRYYFAQTISNPNNLAFDPFFYSASSNESDGFLDKGKAISENPEAKGVYMENDEIGLLGRNNTDLRMKDSEVIMRAGRHTKEDITKFNKTDQAYVQIRHALENSSSSRKTKTISKIEVIPATHTITIASDSQNRLLMKVIRVLDNSIEESFSSGYSSRMELVLASKTKLRDWQAKYPQWELVTSMEELESQVKIYPNSKIIRRVEVEEVEEGSVNKFIGSVVNIVADKINLISHKNRESFNLNEQDSLISPQEQENINTNAHPMVFGDKLVEFISLLVDFVKNHSHPYHGLKPVNDEIVRRIAEYNLDELINEHIKLA